jgi:hypothetical protein
MILLSITFSVKQQWFSEYILNSCRLNLVCIEEQQEFCMKQQDFKMEQQDFGLKQQKFCMKQQQFRESVLGSKMEHHTLRLSSLRFCMKQQDFKMKQQEF